MRYTSISLLVTLLTLCTPALIGASTGGPVLNIPESAGEQCVEPTPVMRREHMKLLLAQRDRTVHEGIRGGPHSLVGCVECHATRNTDGTPVSVNAPGEFCESCHSFAGVRMDCFGCHASRPDE